MSTMIAQEVLSDKTGSGRAAPWRVHKMSAEMLSMAYEEIDPRKAVRVRDCASMLSFAATPEGGKKLVAANFCRVRLCPMCQWRRSRKVYGQVSAIMAHLAQQRPYAYILVTLTRRNVAADQLGQALDDLSSAWNRLRGYAALRPIKGWYKAVEITHNLSDGTYHPHIHTIWAVVPSYFTSTGYISQAALTEMWQRAARLDYTPIIDMRRVKGDTARAVAEVAKYAVKPGDYIRPEDWDLTVETVRELDSVLDNRRFISFGGVMADAHKALHLDDADDGDLVGATAADVASDAVASYIWHSGYSQYIRLD